MRSPVCSAVLLLAMLSLGLPAAAQVVGSAHDLSASGPGPVRATSEPEVCIFCHTPHNASPSTPLWNRTFSGSVYIPYSSSTLIASPGQPTGSSKLCLSCHDGTIGLGLVLSRSTPIQMTGELPRERSLTTDLSDDHPVSFVYDSLLAGDNAELELPDLLPGAIELDRNGELQCTSCHDAHWSPHPDFLVLGTEFSELCLGCHNKEGWIGSSHEGSGATWNGTGPDPWPHTDHATVAANACESCHDPHNAGGAEWILNEPAEEDNCLYCHNGNVAGPDIASDLLKQNHHPVEDYLGVHDPQEDFDVMPWHVECQDCHNPHAVTDTTASAPTASGALNLVAGVSLSGSPIEPAEFQYEVCFRCHADNVNAPASTFARVVEEPNLRLRLDLGNPSFHPVAGPGQNPFSPSLISPWTEASVMYCTDCHASNNGPGAGGSGPAGPHGSIYPYILERQYRTADNTPESAAAYALCYKCHSQGSILGDQSFEDHDKHIRGESTPCSVCHDPHGVPIGGAGDQTHLINFRTDVVSALGNGQLEFIDQGDRAGQCYLVCHGRNHNPEGYGPGN